MSQRKMLRLLWILIFLMNANDLFAMSRRPAESRTLGDRYAVRNSYLSPKVEPLTLQKCYELALKQSEKVAIQKESVSQTQADFLKAASEAIGDMDFVITDDFRENQEAPTTASSGSSVGSTFTSEEIREKKFVITQPLFQGFKDIAALTGAGSLRNQRKGEWERAKQTLFEETAAAFYSLLEKHRDLETIQGIHNLLNERITDLEEREKIGRSRTSEVVTSRSRIKVLEAELAQAKGEFQIARHLLEFLIGTPVEPEQLVDDDILEGVVSFEELTQFLEEVRSRPDVEAARNAVKTAKRSVVVAQSGLWPKIDLDGNIYKKREGFTSDIDWEALFTVTIPLYKGGEVFGEIRNAWSHYKKSKLTHELSIREARYEVKEAFENWASAVEQERALRDAVKASEENYDLQKEEYSKNLVSNLDVLQALESLLDTRRSSNDVHYEAKVNYWKFQVARGNCCHEPV